MTILQEADALYVGSTPVDAVYAGGERVWPSGFSPASLVGLTVWLDAPDYAEGFWPNVGSGGDGLTVGTPWPVYGEYLNGRPVVRFKPSEGRIRGTGMCVDGSFDLTVIYLSRMVGPTVGRVFTNTYPPYNFLVGFHSSGYDLCYDNGWVGNTYAFGTLPTPWKLYGFVSSGVPRRSEFFVDGVSFGFHGSSVGHDNRWNLSGYAATEETCDCEVAELVCYDRPLTAEERQQVEGYLRDKWALA